jgi:hypothetical protein
MLTLHYSPRPFGYRFYSALWVLSRTVRSKEAVRNDMAGGSSMTIGVFTSWLPIANGSHQTSSRYFRVAIP